MCKLVLRRLERQPIRWLWIQMTMQRARHTCCMRCAKVLGLRHRQGQVRGAMSQHLPATPVQELSHRPQSFSCERQAQRRLRQRVRWVRRDRSGMRMVTRLQLPVGWSIPRMQCGSAHMVGATIDCDASSLMGAIASDDFLLQMPLQKVTDHARNVHLESG